MMSEPKNKQTNKQKTSKYVFIKTASKNVLTFGFSHQDSMFLPTVRESKTIQAMILKDVVE